jgi:hypothetical protein
MSDKADRTDATGAMPDGAAPTVRVIEYTATGRPMRVVRADRAMGQRDCRRGPRYALIEASKKFRRTKAGNRLLQLRMAAVAGEACRHSTQKIIWLRCRTRNPRNVVKTASRADLHAMMA